MKNWSHIYQWSILITTALIPSGIYELALAFVALSGLCWLVLKRYKDVKSLKTEPQYIFSILLYAYIFFSGFFSEGRGEAISSWSVYFPLLFFPLFLGQSGIISGKLIKRIEIIFLGSTALSITIMLAYALYDTTVTGVNTVVLNLGEYNKYSSFGLTRVFGHFHPTYFSMCVNHSIFICFELIYKSYQEENKKHLFIYLGLSLILIFSLLLLNSMMGVLVFFIILFYYSIVLLRRLGFTILKRVSIVAIFISLCVGFIYFNPLHIYKLATLKEKKLKPTDDFNERNLLTIRLAKWDTHLMIIKRHFWFGTTEGDIKPIRKAAYLEKGYKNLAENNYNAHNQYLEIFANCGFFGFLLFIGMLITPFFRKRSRSFYLFMIIVLVTWLTESTWELQQGFNYMMFFFTLYTAALSPGIVEKEKRNISPA